MGIEKNNIVVVEHKFRAPVPKVYGALKEGRLFFHCSAWPTETKIDFRIGGKYRLDWGLNGASYGEFTKIVENKQIAFTWNIDSKEGDLRTNVTIDLTAHEGGALLRLRHEGFEDAGDAAMFDKGWADNIKDVDAELVDHVVHMSRTFPVPVDRLFEACSGLAFFGSMGATASNAQIDFRVGGKYRLDLEKKQLRGEFLEIVKNEKIVFTWEAAPCGEPVNQPTRVTLELGPWGEGGKHSYIDLVHEGFDTDDATVAHHSGWNSVLEKIFHRSSR